MTPAKKYTILIIDDSPEDRAAFRRYLSRDPTRVFVFEEASLGAEGLERLNRTDAPGPDCLLLDYNLPDISGIDFLAELQEGNARVLPGGEQERETPLPCAVVMLTGSGDEAAAVAAMKAGVQDYLVKGKLSADTLQQAVRNSIERFDLTWRLHDSEARLRLATEAAGIGTWTFHPQTGAVDGDARYRELLDLPPSGVLNRALCLSRVYEEDRPRVVEAMRAAMELSGTGRYNVEYRTLPYPHDGYRWVQSIGQVYFDTANGAVERCVGTALEVTDRKNLEEERQRHAAQQEHIAEALQRSLLISPPKGAFPGLDVHIEYRIALEEAMVGGDFADAFALDGDHVALVVGDVTGKGLAAATYTAEIKFALRAYLRESPDVAFATRRLNRYLANGQRLDTNPHWQLVALAVVVIHTRTGQIDCCCAGADPPLIVTQSREDGVWKARGVDIQGLLLGIEEDSEYRSTSLVLAKGDLLIITTDGITEARAGRHGEFFGYEGLARSAEDAASVPNLVAAAQSIIFAAQDFAEGAQRDDVCLLAARLLPSEERE